MCKTVSYKDIQVSYSELGAGKCIVLIHGYLESIKIWDSLFKRLSSSNRVVVVDLLGHGNSGVIGNVSTMEDMADQIKYVLDYLGIEECVMVGHSMGGYVTMAFAEKYSKQLSGYVLCHSHAYADSEEKKADREKAINAITQGKKKIMVNSAIPSLYADANQERCISSINLSRKIALNTSDEGIIAALAGMKNRLDRTAVLENVDLPVLFLIGRNDNLIPCESLVELANIYDNVVPYVLENSGHMGFVEQEDETYEAIRIFVGA